MCGWRNVIQIVDDPNGPVMERGLHALGHVLCLSHSFLHRDWPACPFRRRGPSSGPVPSVPPELSWEWLRAPLVPRFKKGFRYIPLESIFARRQRGYCAAADKSPIFLFLSLLSGVSPKMDTFHWFPPYSLLFILTSSEALTGFNME